jgi:ribosomal-protein-alanine N-acetyltransferase
VEGVSLPRDLRIRRLRETDIDEVVRIEREAFTTPWQAETFAGLMERDGVELTVMTKSDDEVVGYAILWCVLDQGELANIAIAAGHRGAGLGAHLLRHVLDVARARGVARVFLEVRASNRAALGLYSRFGFDEVGRRKNYYERPREDALVLRADLDVSSGHPGNGTGAP